MPPGTLTALDASADGRGEHQMKIQLNDGDGQTTVMATFTGPGQPQSITVPPAFTPVAGSR